LSLAFSGLSAVWAFAHWAENLGGYGFSLIFAALPFDRVRARDFGLDGAVFADRWAM
jgi:hypothetical protein